MHSISIESSKERLSYKCTLYHVKCKLCSAHCVLFGIYCIYLTVYTVHCTMYMYTLYSVHTTGIMQYV